VSLGHVVESVERRVQVDDTSHAENNRVLDVVLSAAQELPAAVIGVMRHEQDGRSIVHDVTARDARGVAGLLELVVAHADQPIDDARRSERWGGGSVRGARMTARPDTAPITRMPNRNTHAHGVNR